MSLLVKLPKELPPPLGLSGGFVSLQPENIVIAAARQATVAATFLKFVF